MKKLKVNEEGYAHVLVVVVLAMAVVVACYFALWNLASTGHGSWFQINPTPTSSTTPSPSASPSQTSIPAGWAKFTHPTAGYSLYYPKVWKGGLVKGTDFESFHVESPDHKVAAQYPALEQGAELTVDASRTNKSLDDTYNSSQIGAVVNRNKIATKVGGQDAIQYDWAYEQMRATSTIFLKDGVLYTATLRFVDEQGKQAFWSDYAQLLASIKLN